MTSKASDPDTRASAKAISGRSTRSFMKRQRDIPAGRGELIFREGAGPPSNTKNAAP